MKQELITVTPEMATEWLERNPCNRPTRSASVRYFETQLRSGRAATTHQGIAINVRGELQDGQHRCHAIKNTGIPWSLWVAYDCPVDNFHLVDVGTKRTMSDFLHIRGYKNSKHLAAVGTIAWQWYRGRASFTGQTTDEELVKLYDAYPSIIDAAMVDRRELGIVKSMLSFMSYLGPEDFIADLLNDVIDPATHGGRLAEKYVDRVKQRKKMDKKTTMALFIKSANDHVAGKVAVRAPRFSQAEAFPIPGWNTPIQFGAGATEEDEEE